MQSPTLNIVKIGKRIHLRRVELDMTPTDLASKSGVTAVTISRIERGLIYPNLGTMGRVAAALGMSLAELIAIGEE